MPESEWQHFVPQMYLKGFLDPAKVAAKQHVLWVYEKGRKPKLRGPVAVAADHGFYHTPENLGAEDLVESMLSKIETIAREHIEKLRTGAFPPTPQEKAELSTFLGNLRFRTRVFRDLLNASAIEGFRRTCQRLIREGKVAEMAEAERITQRIDRPVNMESMESFVQGMADGTIELTQTGKAWTIGQAFEAGEKLAAQLECMRWLLIEARPGESFITCDNPVYLSNGSRSNQPKPLFSRELQMIFPVSPRYLLFGEFSDGPDLTHLAAAGFPRDTWQAVLERAHLQVYASFDSKELQAQVTKELSSRGPLYEPLT